MSGRLAGVFEVLPSPAFLVNLKGEVTDVNSAALKFLECQSKDVQQKDLLEVLISVEERGDAGVYLKEALEGAASEKTLKVTCVGRTGRKQVCLRAQTIRNGGKLDGAILTLQDMAEIRDLVGTTNTGGAEHLSGALNAISTALFALNTDGKILEWTSKMEKITGFASGHASGQNMTTFCITESFKSSMRKSLEQALRGTDVPRFTIEINTSGGRSKEVWMTMAPWRSATGRIVGAIGQFEDAVESDRRVSEADWIREASAEQLDLANAFVFSVDTNMSVTEWNHRLADVTGKEKEAIAGKKFLDLVAANSRQQVTDALRATIQGEWSAPMQISTTLNLEMTVGFSPQLNFSGKVIGVLAIGQPMLTSPAPAGPVGPATAPNKDVKSMVLHEVRSPLHGIIGLANTLSQDAGPMKKPLTMIGLSAERALELATNMMDYWNLELQPVREGKEDMVDLAALAKEVVTKSKNFKDKSGRSLKKDKVNFQTEIQNVTVAADSYNIQQMCCQLLSNAFKFTTDGEVSFSIKEVDKCAVIKVSDTGCGMKPEVLEGVQAFSPGDASESRKHDGIGLGLSLVKEVVRIHGGRCDFKAKAKGTEVTVTIPCQPPEKVENKEDKAAAKAETTSVSWTKAPTAKQKGPPSSWLGPVAQLGIQAVPRNTAANGGSRTATSLPSLKEGIATADQLPEFVEEEDNLIMSVDDDYVNQEVMRSILEPCGFKVIACMNGTECLEYLDGQNPRPRLLLLDLMMPGLSGFDVLQALQKKVSLMELPVVMVSAKNQSSSVVKGYELGCRDWIHKPFCRQELIARVKCQLKMRTMLLSYRFSASHERSQENLPVVEEDHSTERTNSRKDVQESIANLDGPADTAALFATVDSEVALENLASVFQDFENLSEQYQAFRTEIVGSSYLVIFVGTEDETCHTDKLLLLAHKLLDTAKKASLCLRLGIDTDTSEPAKWQGDRRYPKNSLFSATLEKARKLSDAAADNRILLSRNARCRLSADVEAELQQSGLRLLSGDASSPLGEHYFIAETNESDPTPLRAQTGPPPPPSPEPVQQVDSQPAEMLLQSQIQLQALHQELLKSQNGVSLLQQQLGKTEEQMLQAKSEASTLRAQLQAAKVAAAVERPSLPELPKEKTPEISGPTPQSTSLLFLQWQNAHLQAEVRHYQSALSSTKMELQMQIMAGQLLESKHNLLQARVEHLELDLGFKVAVGGNVRIEEASDGKGSASPESPVGLVPPTGLREDALGHFPFGQPGVPGLAMPGALGAYSRLPGMGATALGVPNLATFQPTSFGLPGMSPSLPASLGMSTLGATLGGTLGGSLTGAPPM